MTKPLPIEGNDFFVPFLADRGSFLCGCRFEVTGLSKDPREYILNHLDPYVKPVVPVGGEFFKVDAGKVIFP